MTVFDLIVNLAGLASGFWLLWRIPTCRPIADRRAIGDGSAAVHSASRLEVESAPERVSVVIPARNEEERLPSLLRSLSSQVQPASEVVVVDDGSTDATAAIARASAAVLVAPGDPPNGWLGKPWACWNGALAATGSVLIFLDADVVLAPNGLARLVREHADLGGLLTLQPYHTVGHAYEQLSAFFNVVLMMGIGAFTPLGRRRSPGGAFGPCLVCRRDEYLASGGHRAVAGEVLDDVALGREFIRAGLAVRCLGGGDVVSFRMYPGGIGQMVEGWSKNFAVGAGSIARGSLLLVMVWILGCIGSAFALLGLPTLGDLAWDPLPHSFGVALYVACATQLWWMLRRIGSFRWWAWALYVAPLVCFVAVFTRSLWLTLARGRVTWRGRELHLRGPGAGGLAGQ